MATKVEIKFGWVCNANIDRRSRWNVATLTDLLLLICTEQSCVMSFLHNDECYSRAVIRLELHAGFTNGEQLVGQDLQELSLTNAIPIENNPVGLESSRLVELDEQLPDHCGEVVDNFLTMLLNTHSGSITTRVSIHATNNLKKSCMSHAEIIEEH